MSSFKGWIGNIASIFLAPLIGMSLAGLSMVAVYWILREETPKESNKLFRRLQLVVAATLSWTRGTNDAQ